MPTTNRCFATVVLLLAIFANAFLFVSSQATADVTFDWRSIGDIGNPADTRVMDKGFIPDMSTGYGSVDYPYQIAATHVTNVQYAEFLNAVDPVSYTHLTLPTICSV